MYQVCMYEWIRGISFVFLNMEVKWTVNIRQQVRANHGNVQSISWSAYSNGREIAGLLRRYIYLTIYWLPAHAPVNG